MILEDGALQGVSPSQAQRRGAKGRGGGEEPLPETRDGLSPMEKTLDVIEGNPARF